VSEFKLLLSIPPFTKPMDILELKLWHFSFRN
jgi:hypothetical protein